MAIGAKELIGIIVIGIFIYTTFGEYIAPRVLPTTNCPEGYTENPENEKECIPKSVGETSTLQNMRKLIFLGIFMLFAYLIFGGKKNGKKQ